MGNQILSSGPAGYETLDFDAIDELRQINDRVLVINGGLYAWGQPFSVDDVDISTFEGWPDNDAYARDGEHVYFIFNRSFRIDGAHRESFEPFEKYGAYARDAEHVYYQGQVLEDADRETFEIAFDGDSPYARDKNGRYFMGSRQQ